MSADEDRKALEALILDNTELEALEVLIAEFNIFEAIGMIQQEIKHSQLLGLLLDPYGNHGLGDLFLKRILIRALRDADSTPVRPIDLDLMELGSASVQREWQNIDILVTDPVNQLVCIIDNKVFTGEHDEQLQRYYSIVRQQYPGWRIVPLYLTPDGDDPSDDRYIAISYKLIAEALEGLLRSRASTIGEDIRTLISHYVTMLRRHIVTDSEIADLCRRIYERHQRALDLIFEHRPDLQSQISQYLVNLVRSHPSMTVYAAGKSEVNFRPIAWDNVPELVAGSEARNAGRGMLMFHWMIGSQRLDLRLYIGPGPMEIRSTLFSIALNHGKPFELSQKYLAQKWNSIYNRHVLRSTDLADAELTDLTGKIDGAWQHFLEEDLPLFDELFARGSILGTEGS